MKKQVLLTVSESKRLIAKAVAGLESVQRAKREGVLVLATGTTNGYVAEELLGRPIDKRAYRSGTTAPARPDRSPEPQTPKIPDMVWRNGQLDLSLDRCSAVPFLKQGDVFVKGANALDYHRKLAGILIGGENSQTIGNAIGTLIGSRVELVIPVGLEKLVYEDIYQISRACGAADCEGLRVFPVSGTIVTEIEAFKLLAGVDATLIAAGGVAGAEGAVWLLVEGDESQVNRAMELAQAVQGEPRYLL